MKNSPRARKTATLPDSLQHQLAAYALSASAAGVGMLALAQSAEAKIIYTHVRHVIRRDHSFRIDLNHDGIAELSIINSRFQRTDGALVNLIRAASNSESVGVASSGYPSNYPLDAALKRGTRIGTGMPFDGPKGLLVGQCSHGTNAGLPPCYSFGYNRVGVWGNVKNRYLGLKFSLHGKTHYGWVRLSVAVSHDPLKAKATVTGYAYETIANKPILAGKTTGKDVVTVQPASLGHLAAGASAVPNRRVKQTVASAH